MSNIRVEMKQTMWINYYFKEGSDINVIIEALKKDHNDIYDESIGCVDSEDMLDTCEDMTVKDNKGNSTIEVYKDGKIVWENGS